MATNNSVDSPLAGTTGTGSFVGATSPTITTPNIVGVTNGSNAAAGSVGEFVSSVISVASAVSLSNSIAKDITLISLTAGDWDVWGNIFFTASAINGTAVIAWTSTSSASAPDSSLRSQINANIGPIGINVPELRYSLSGTTTIFLSGIAVFGTGTYTGCGGIYARRVR